MKSRQKIGLGLIVSVIATAVLLVVLKVFGTGTADMVGFGLLIGLSFAALCK